MKVFYLVWILLLPNLLVAEEAYEKSCVEGLAGQTYPCSSISLMSELDLKTSGLRAAKANDIWGWTDSQTGREYALMGLDSKTAIVDVTDPLKPVHVVDIATKTYSSTWRDIKVYKNYALIVSEAPRHGMQIFDLTRLRKLTPFELPATLEEDVHYPAFGNAHNIVMNEESGFAYAVGTNTCDRGMHVVDMRNPLAPKFSTCIDRQIFEPPQGSRNKHGEDYTHDAQCVIYKGPDKRYTGHEICFCSNADSVNIVDVTNKAEPHQVSVLRYQGVGYTHQGWMTEDHKYFFLGDETDELETGNPTKTFIMDFIDLEKPEVIDYYLSQSRAIDHNMYVKGQYLYQANYNAGLRILDVSDVAKGKLKEVAFFDTMPDTDDAKFAGAWSVYPYFESGHVVISNINGVLYTVRPQL